MRKPERLRYEVHYIPNSYQQHDLPLRRRLKDEDVEEFIRAWLRGSDARYLGNTFRSPGYWARPGAVRGPLTFVHEGAPLHYKMVYTHLQRLAEQGLLEPRFARERPNWRRLAHEAAGIPLPMGTSKRPEGNGGYEFLPVGLRTAGGRGRPRKRLNAGKDYQSPLEMLRARPTSDEPLVIHVYDPDALPPGAAGGVLDPAAFERERQAIEQAEAQARQQAESLARAEIERAKERAARELAQQDETQHQANQDETNQDEETSSHEPSTTTPDPQAGQRAPQARRAPPARRHRQAADARGEAQATQGAPRGDPQGAEGQQENAARPKRWSSTALEGDRQGPSPGAGGRARRRPAAASEPT